MNLQLSEADLGEAEATIRGFVHRTPVFSSRSLTERAGFNVWLKAECLQKTGSFKPRGAFNKVRHLPKREAARGVVTASAGNHGQAVAYVAAHEGIPGVVVMPTGANPSKVAAVKEYGARAILHGRIWDDAYACSLELALSEGLLYVHPFKDRHILAGQATVALEILEDLPAVDAVVIPIGGGGLIAGMAMALRLRKPSVRIIGVEPEGSANMFTSRRQGAAVNLEAVRTIADGLATKNTDPEMFSLIQGLADDLVTVTDEEIAGAVSFLMERAKLVTELAGAATVGALLSGKVSLPAQAVAVAVVSGGNLDIGGRLRFVW
jgi:threonine dehydratase